MRMRLSTDYESVYSKVIMMGMIRMTMLTMSMAMMTMNKLFQVEEAKRKSREESYKNVKLNLQSHDDSAA